MVALKEIVRHPTHAFNHAYNQKPACNHRTAYSILGLVAIGVGVYVAISLFPEVRRYVRIERM